jgi:Flp pilus assembly protein TadD
MLSGALFSLGRLEEGRVAAGRALRAIDARLTVVPDDSRALHLGAVLAARLGDRDLALAYARQSLELRPDEFATTYNVACAYAVLGMRGDALDALDRAVRTGRGDLGWIEHDPDFETLRAEPRFGEIVGRLRAKHGGPTG